MTESGKYRGFGREITRAVPEYRHTGADFEYFANERVQLQVQIDRIKASVARIKEPSLDKDPEEIASFWQKMAPEIEKKEKERKSLRLAEGTLDSILEEYEHPEKGMPKARAYLEEKMKGVRNPEEIADEIKKIAAERDEIDDHMEALRRNLEDAEKHVEHVNEQIKEHAKGVIIYLGRNEKLKKLLQEELWGLSANDKLTVLERLKGKDKVLDLKFRQRDEYDRRKLHYDRHLQDCQVAIVEAEKKRKAGFRKQSQLKEEYNIAVELVRAKEALEERVAGAKK